MAPTAKRLQINPNANGQSMVLFTSGRINPKGGALDPMAVSTPPVTFYAGADAAGPIVAFQVIDWTQPSGYVMTYHGDIFPWGPSGAVPAVPSPPPVTTDPLKVVCDFVMNPAGNGAGYQLYIDGQVKNFGGAPAVAAGPSLPGGTAKRMAMEYSSKKYYVLEQQGGLYARAGAPTLVPPVNWPGWDSARAVDIYNWTVGRGYMLELQGGVYALGAGVQQASGGPAWPGTDAARDLKIIDSGIDPLFPLKLRILDSGGSVHTWVASTHPNVTAGGEPQTMNSPEIATTRPRLMWSYLDREADAQIHADVLVFRESVTDTFTSTRQRVHVTGTPTGGTFRLRLGGQRTATFAYNASAATVQASLDLIWGVPDGSIVVSGTFGGVNGMLFDFGGGEAFARCLQPLLIVEEVALTGGTSPTVAVSYGVEGTDVFNTKRAQTIYKDETTEANRRFFDVTKDLSNDEYRMFVKVRDASKLYSPVSVFVWEQDVPIPPAPTLTATNRGGLHGILLAPTFTTPPVGAKFRVEFSDDFSGDPDTATWEEVRYFAGTGGGVVIGGSVTDARWRDPAVGWRDPTISWRGGAATAGPASGDAVTDYEAPFGMVRWYRAIVYTDDPYLSSEPSAPVPATLTGGGWSLIPIEAPVDGQFIDVIPPFDFSKTSAGGAVYGAGSKFPVVSRDGAPRALTSTLSVRVLSKEQKAALDRVTGRGETMLLRNSYGEAWYVSLIGEASYSHPVASPTATEIAKGYQTRYLQTGSLPLVEGARPPVAQPDPYADLLPG